MPACTEHSTLLLKKCNLIEKGFITLARGQSYKLFTDMIYRFS